MSTHVLASPGPARSAATAAVALLVGCSSPPAGTLQLVTGPETDTFSRAPVPASLEVDSVDSSGNETKLASVTLPAATIDLGTMAQATVGALAVTGRDASGNRVVFGQSVPWEFGALDGLTIPLFVQRTGDLARMPGPLSDARSAPLVTTFAGRYLLVAGGTDPSLATACQLYDFSTFAPLSSPPTLPLAPKSAVFMSTVGVFIGDSAAMSYDFAQSTSAAVTPPSGAAFADVAGGATVVAADGTQFVVGATRQAGAATSAVLAFDANGNAAWVTLSAPRLGAAATWVQGRGLVVAGGSATADGVEIVSTGAMLGSGIGYPPDPTTGAGATALDGEHVLLAGGALPDGTDSGARAIDLTCAKTCAPTVWSALPAALTTAQVFSSSATAALVVGDDTSGATQAFALTPTAATSVPTKVPMAGARATVSPLGSVVLFGGDVQVESFVP